MNREDQTLRVLTILLRASGSVINMLKKDMSTYGVNPTEFTVLEVLYSLGEQPIQIIGNKVLFYKCTAELVFCFGCGGEAYLYFLKAHLTE